MHTNSNIIKCERFIQHTLLILHRTKGRIYVFEDTLVTAHVRECTLYTAVVLQINRSDNRRQAEKQADITVNNEKNLQLLRCARRDTPYVGTPWIPGNRSSCSGDGPPSPRAIHPERLHLLKTARQITNTYWSFSFVDSRPEARGPGKNMGSGPVDPERFEKNTAIGIDTKVFMLFHQTVHFKRLIGLLVIYFF